MPSPKHSKQVKGGGGWQRAFHQDCKSRMPRGGVSLQTWMLRVGTSYLGRVTTAPGGPGETSGVLKEPAPRCLWLGKSTNPHAGTPCVLHTPPPCQAPATSAGGEGVRAGPLRARARPPTGASARGRRRPGRGSESRAAVTHRAGLQGPRGARR